MSSLKSEAAIYGSLTTVKIDVSSATNLTWHFKFASKLFIKIRNGNNFNTEPQGSPDLLWPCQMTGHLKQ